MPSPVDQLRAEFQSALSAAASVAAVKAVRDQFLSRKHGRLTALLKAVGSAAPEERKALGAQANALKQDIEAALDAREAELDRAGAAAGRRGRDAAPGAIPASGRRHPLTQVRERIEEIFLGMGYQIIDGPELEDDWHNFEALNMPPEHPARDMQDTLYLASPVPTPGGGRPATLLRTHTSGMQIRYMEAHKPPVRIIAPGRVYRRDNFDATHTPMFTQVEGLVVDEGISIGDLKGTLNAFAQQFFDTEIRTRFRPSFFPYTEPSRRARRGVPGLQRRRLRALQAHGLDRDPRLRHGASRRCSRPWATTRTATPDSRSASGIERLALRLYGIEDIRMFYENDARFLRQVPR